MRRREFITLLGGPPACPLAARAQQPTMPVVGWLDSTTLENRRDSVLAFRRGLSEVGCVPGQNVAIEHRRAERSHQPQPLPCAKRSAARAVSFTDPKADIPRHVTAPVVERLDADQGPLLRIA